jgi:hypothetical protein
LSGREYRGGIWKAAWAKWEKAGGGVRDKGGGGGGRRRRKRRGGRRRRRRRRGEGSSRLGKCF